MARSRKLHLPIDQFDAAAMGLDDMGELALFRLIKLQCRVGKPLPDDDHYLARSAGVGLRRWRVLRPQLATRFAVCDGFWSLNFAKISAAKTGDNRAIISSRSHTKCNKNKVLAFKSSTGSRTDSDNREIITAKTHTRYNENKVLAFQNGTKPSLPPEVPSPLSPKPLISPPPYTPLPSPSSSCYASGILCENPLSVHALGFGHVPATGKGGVPFRFFGEVIRLTKKDFDRWRELYPYIDLEHQLRRLDLEFAHRLGTGEKIKNWFVVASQKLNYQNEHSPRKPRPRPKVGLC